MGRQTTAAEVSMGNTEPVDEELKRLEALRAVQQREMGRGCLLALVLDSAAMLAAVLWLIATLLEMPRLRLTAAGAFLVFTLAAAVTVLMMMIQGNLPGQRRLRQEHERALERRGSS